MSLTAMPRGLIHGYFRPHYLRLPYAVQKCACLTLALVAEVRISPVIRSFTCAVVESFRSLLQSKGA